MPQYEYPLRLSKMVSRVAIPTFPIVVENHDGVALFVGREKLRIFSANSIHVFSVANAGKKETERYQILDHCEILVDKSNCPQMMEVKAGNLQVRGQMIAPKPQMMVLKAGNLQVRGQTIPPKPQMIVLKAGNLQVRGQMMVLKAGNLQVRGQMIAPKPQMMVLKAH